MNPDLRRAEEALERIAAMPQCCEKDCILAAVKIAQEALPLRASQESRGPRPGEIDAYYQDEHRKAMESTPAEKPKCGECGGSGMEDAEWVDGPSCPSCSPAKEGA